MESGDDEGCGSDWATKGVCGRCRAPTVAPGAKPIATRAMASTTDAPKAWYSLMVYAAGLVLSGVATRLRQTKAESVASRSFAPEGGERLLRCV